MKNLYNALKEDKESIFFSSEKITKQLIKKVKKSRYDLSLYNNIEDVNLQEEEVVIPTFVPFVDKKKDIDRSTLYSFSKPFEILHADIADIRFFAKSAADPHYCLLFVDLFTEKIYIYPMKKRDLLKKKMELFYEKISNKRSNETMRLQTDLEFQ